MWNERIHLASSPKKRLLSSRLVSFVLMLLPQKWPVDTGLPALEKIHLGSLKQMSLSFTTRKTKLLALVNA